MPAETFLNNPEEESLSEKHKEGHLDLVPTSLQLQKLSPVTQETIIQ